MSVLSERELFVVEQRAKGLSYQAIADLCAQREGFGEPSRERIRQINQQAIKALIAHAVEEAA